MGSRSIRFFEYGKARAFFCSWAPKVLFTSCGMHQHMNKAGVREKRKLTQGFTISLLGVRKTFGVAATIKNLDALTKCQRYSTIGG